LAKHGRHNIGLYTPLLVPDKPWQDVSMERVRKEIVIANFEKMIRLEEINLRKKSRMMWLKEEDKNSNLFSPDS
jgi:hypothetical protein